MKRTKKRFQKNKPRTCKIMVVSLGCAKNLVDTEVMCGNLASAGYILTNVAEAADIMLINTCSFIQDARTESAEAIESALAWRQQNNRRRLAVAGCWPQQEADELLTKYPQIDLLLGLDEIPVIADLFSALLIGRTKGIQVSAGNPRYLYDHDTARLQLTPANYAFVKIAEGCSHRCSFCSIPFIRGRLRSRAIESVLNECRMLLNNGVHELNFIGQDITAYGRDRGEKDALLSLIDQCDTLPGNFWLRLLYTHPLHLSDGLLSRLNQSDSHLLPYLDMPLQHIDDSILHSMGRGLGENKTRRLLMKIKERCSNLALRTTFIVGYPGETEAAFNKLVDLVRSYRFTHVGVFMFSAEPGTKAASHSEQLVDTALAAERKEILLQEQQKISAEINRLRIGSIMPVLVEKPDEGGHWLGRTVSDAPEVDGMVHFSGNGNCLKPGIVNVRITDSEAYDLHGELVAGP